MNKRAELHCHSKMSEMRGLVDMDFLVEDAKEKGVSAIAITDTNSVQEFPDLYKRFNNSEEEATVKFIYGMEAWMCDDLSEADYEKQESYRISILVAKQEGFNSLYKLYSSARSYGSDPFSTIPKSIIKDNREGIIIGCGGAHGEIMHAVSQKVADDQLKEIVEFYDYVEVEPPVNYVSLLCLKSRYNMTVEEATEAVKRIVELSEGYGVPVVATTDVYYLHDFNIDSFKMIRYADGIRDYEDWTPKHHLISAEELLDEFSFLDENVARQIVIDNPNKIVADIPALRPIPAEKCHPIYPNANQELRDICYKRVHEIYGDVVPEEASKRLEDELTGIAKADYSSVYMIYHDLVKYNNDSGYLVGSRGCSGASFVSFLAGITMINPLPAHYYCRSCGYSDFEVKHIKGYHVGNCGVDLPDKACPKCGKNLAKDGFDTPFEVFLGLDFDKEPDFNINVSGDMQDETRRYLSGIKGIGTALQAGTISTISMKQAIRFSNEYNNTDDDYIDYEADQLVGVKQKDGLHPGAMLVSAEDKDVYDYTPIAHHLDSEFKTAHFEWHSLDKVMLKVNILSHTDLTMIKCLHDETGVDPESIPLDDKGVMSLFSGVEALGISEEDVDGFTLGTLGSAGISSDFIKTAIETAKPNNLSDLIRLFAAAHGTGAWIDNSEELVQKDGISFADCISCREDIMLYLESLGMDREEAYSIMDCIRAGKGYGGIHEEWVNDMKNIGVPDWYIESCEKIHYLFPKIHAAIYTVLSFKNLYYKLYYPEAFYRAWLRFRARYVDEEFIKKGYDYVNSVYNLLKSISDNELDYDEKIKKDEALVVLEMYARGCEQCV